MKTLELTEMRENLNLNENMFHVRIDNLHGEVEDKYKIKKPEGEETSLKSEIWNIGMMFFYLLEQEFPFL